MTDIFKDSRESQSARDGGAVMVEGHDHMSGYSVLWTREIWEQDKVEFCQRELKKAGINFIQDGVKVVGATKRSIIASKIIGRDVREPIIVPRMIPITHGITSDVLRALVGDPDDVMEIAGNLLLQEGITRITSLIIGAGGNAFNNANSFLGVGDSTTAEAATQTELQATQNAANRFYKGMVATYPQRSGGFSQTIDFRSDFTSTEANFVWNEWTAAEGATTASGSGFLVGTTNMNRKVQSLGTKTTGTWTLTGSITFS